MRRKPDSMILGVALALAIVGLIFMLLAKTAGAGQIPCAPAESMAEQLGKFREAPMARGLTSNGMMMRLWISPDGSTWTITITRPDGLTCLMSAGESLDLLQWKRPEEKESGALFHLAHDHWIGEMYPGCCSKSQGDCREIPGVSYDSSSGVFKFTYGGWPYTVPEDQARKSEDRHYWACFDQTGQVRERCFFRPPSGS